MPISLQDNFKSKWEGSNLRPESPKLPALPNWATPSYFFLEEEVGVDPNTFQYRPFSRRGHKPLWFIFLLMLSHKGSNLDSSGPKPDVLPITP